MKNLAEKICMWSKPNHTLTPGVGLKAQIEAAPKEYNKLTLEVLEDFIEELSKSKVEDNRRFTIGANKQGAINCLKATYQKVGFTEHVIRVKLAKIDLELEEGYYVIDSSGISKYGII